jgi:hypothetical protein
MVQSTDHNSNEVWARYLIVTVVAAVLLGVAFAINIVAASLGL